MDNFCPKSVYLAVSNKTPWNQSNPQVPIDPNHPGLSKLSQPEIVEVYNLSKEFLGLGFFEKSQNTLIYLSSKMGDSFLTETLKDLKQVKDKLFKDYSLVSHELYGLRIDVISTTMIMTLRQAWNPLLPHLQSTLEELFPGHSLYLKNDTSLQSKWNEPQTSKALSLSAPPATLTIQEDLDYKWDLDSKNLFPFELRQIRQWLRELNPQSVLLLGNHQKDLFSPSQSAQIDSFPEFTKTGISEIKNQLTPKTPYEAVVLNMSDWAWNLKNETAFMHFLHSLKQKTTQSWSLLLHDRQPKKTKDLLNLFCKKNKMTLFLKKNAWNEPDIWPKESKKDQYFYEITGKSLSS